MKTKLTMLAACLIAGTVQAVPLDLGPNGMTYLRSYDFSQLNGTQFNGQKLSIDLTFSTQVHLFGNTWPDFLIGIALKTGGGQGFILGTGYVTDINGAPMIANTSLGSADGANSMWVALYPCYADGFARPNTIYGVHFDIVLPTLDATITGGIFALYDQDFIYKGRETAPFRIGPHVPESCATIFLLLLAFLGIIGFNCFVIKTK